MNDTEAPVRAEGVGKNLAMILLLLILVGAGWAWWQMRTATEDLYRTEGALQLQVLTSRLGAAALEAEYGNFDTARDVVSGVYDGIQNYGIEQGSLPENFAEVLRTRDQVITALARGESGVADRLVGLFFRLQIPVDTELDPAFIIPAADSGIGMEPPTRQRPGADTAPPMMPSDTMDTPRESITVPVDTTRGMSRIPPDTIR